MITKGWLISLLLALVTSVGSYAYGEELLNTPVYDPASKSYFEMIDGQKLITGYNTFEGPMWSQAYDLARARVYKGVHGRLAIIKSLQTHEFLKRTFAPTRSNVWIGLRYWCQSRQLQWVDGEKMTPTSFSAWNVRWNQDVYTCASLTPSYYAPIAYGFLPDFTWFGKGIDKRYWYLFVEYPTGQP